MGRISAPQLMYKHARVPTPLRVAPRLQPQVKRMRTRSKKNSLSGKK